jgi:multidrug efflux pump subunit AcrA (membrane-fusion protein)
VGPDSAAAARPVELGTSVGNDVAVVSGLAAGDRVVVDGILKMQPGAVVEATLLAADGAPAPAVSATDRAP